MSVNKSEPEGYAVGIDYRRLYLEFESYKNTKEYSEYFLELSEIQRLLSSIPFDSVQASRLCSDLAGKYENEINQHLSLIHI